MAESQSPPATPPQPPPPPVDYWCYHCDKRVAVETPADQPDVVCNECKFGFVESIPAVVSPPTNRSSDDTTTLGSQFLQVLRLLAQVAREDDAPPPPPPPPLPPRPLNPADPDENDFLRIEIDGWDNDDNDNDNDDEQEDDEWEEEEEEEDGDDQTEEEEEEDVRSVEIEGQQSGDEEERESESEDARRRRRRDILRLRLRDFTTRTQAEGRGQILDWAEILMGLEDNSIEFRFERPETDRYIGNPGDYVNAAEYEALLQNLAEADGRRGAPPAAKSAVENLRIVEIKSEEESYVCAICKDGVNVGEFVKEMPCGHGYHGDCIVPWLASRNSCPVCRFELATDDLEYEEEKRKKRAGGTSGSFGGGGSSSSSGLS